MIASRASVIRPTLVVRPTVSPPFQYVLNAVKEQKTPEECANIADNLKPKIEELNETAKALLEKIRSSYAKIITSDLSDTDRHIAIMNLKATKDMYLNSINDLLVLQKRFLEQCRDALPDKNAAQLRGSIASLEQEKKKVEDALGIMDEEITRARRTQQWETIRDRTGPALESLAQVAVSIPILIGGKFMQAIQGALQHFLTQP